MASTMGTTGPRPPLLQRITARQWLGIDVVLAVLIFVGGLFSILSGPRRNVVLLLVALIVGAGSVALRRKYPLPVLVTVTAALVMSTVLGEGFAGAPVLALPLYIVATQYERRQSVSALCSVGLVLLASLGVAELVRLGRGNATLNFNDVTTNIVIAGAAWFVGDSIRSRRAYIAGMAQQAEQRQRWEMERAEQSIAEERLQIARELHDVVAHSLSVIAIQSGVGGHVLDLQPEEARKALAAVETTSRSALEELRRVLGVLRRDDSGEPTLAPAPGLADLEQLMTQLRGAGLSIICRRHGEAVALSPSMDLSAYRIVQEALTNVTKHAGASCAEVDITFESDAVVISVVDEGPVAPNGARSVPKGDDTGGAHHGIAGMRERAAMFGGVLTAAPAQAGGFEVHARLPFESPDL
jgi:signal transduction histidine kinase